MKHNKVIMEAKRDFNNSMWVYHLQEKPKNNDNAMQQN